MKRRRLSFFNRLRKKTQDGARLDGAQDSVLAEDQTRLSTLPVEVVEQIVENLVDRNLNEVIRDLFAVSMTCRSLNMLLRTEVLYEKVVLFNKKQACKFYKTACKGNSGRFVKHVTFIHPVKEFQAQTSHMGYSMDGASSSEYDKSWAEVILDIMHKLPNLESISLEGVSPNFEFPANLASSAPGAAILRSKLPKLAYLYISSEQGWQVTLRETLLWPFPCYQHIFLHNMTVDPAVSAKVGIPATHLTLSGCKVPERDSIGHVFGNVTNLSIDEHTLVNNHISGIMFPSLESVSVGIIDDLFIFKSEASLYSVLSSAYIPSYLWLENFSAHYSLGLTSKGMPNVFMFLNALKMNHVTLLVGRRSVRSVSKGVKEYMKDSVKRGLESYTFVVPADSQTLTATLLPEILPFIGDFKLIIKDTEGFVLYDNLNDHR
jgi:hypothetical protein